MRVVTPARVNLLPEDRRAAVLSWLRQHGLDPNRTASFAVVGTTLHADCYLVNAEGKFYIEDGDVAREHLTVYVRTSAPL